MHCFTASGGIAQCIVDQMVLRFCAIMGMRVADWVTFHMSLEGIPRLRKDFFKTRIVNDERAHLRGFAADCLAAMTDIGLFILLVLPRDTAMDGEIRCFCHMFTVIQIFRRCNPADLPRLKRQSAQRHLLYVIVFPLCLKPKVHYMFHISKCWEVWQCLLPCYVAEADHRDVCKIFRFVAMNPSSASNHRGNGPNTKRCFWLYPC